MTSFALTTGAHYQKSLNAYTAKTGQREKNFEILRDHIPSLIRRMNLSQSQQRSCFNILSVGSGTGEMDIEIMKIIKKELQKSEQGRHMKLFNRTIEPGEYSFGLYKDTIKNLPSPLNDQLAEFEIFQQTFEEYKESQNEAIKFDMVQFIHNIYYVDMEQALIHCFDKELSEKGSVVCIVGGQEFMYYVMHVQNNKWQGKDKNSDNYVTAENVIEIAIDNGWKHKIYSQEYSIDVTEVFDEKSTEGNLLLDFLTHTVNFREKADKQLVEEALALIKDLTTVKDGKRVGDKKESLILI